MPNLDPGAVIHQLAIKNRARRVKQGQHCFHHELISQNVVKVNKLIQASFIREVKYPI
jgi:hypothetical protein